MKKMAAAANPEAYIAALRGWQRPRVEELRSAVRRAAKLDEVIKWGHLVYFSNGPVLLIRAEESRVLSASGAASACARSNRRSKAEASTKWRRSSCTKTCRSSQRRFGD
jgi:hypothetical protein